MRPAATDTGPSIIMPPSSFAPCKPPKRMARAPLLIIDDLGIASVAGKQYRDLLEILDDRQGQGATLITSQFPVSQWHEIIADATVADAILDRLVHNAYRIELKGESMRKPP